MIRAETRRAIADLIRPAVEALGAVLYPWPTETQPAPTRVVIVSVETEGDMKTPWFGNNTPLRAEDIFRFKLVATSRAPLQNIADAEQLAQELVWAAGQTIHANAQLGGLTKTIDNGAGAGGTLKWRVQSAVVRRVDGPEITDFGDGPTAICTADIECTAITY